MTDSPSTSAPPEHEDAVQDHGLFDPAAPEHVDERIAEERNSELAHHLLTGRRTSDIGQALLAVLVVFVFWESVDSVVALGWFALVATLAALRAAWRARVAPQIDDAMELLRAVRRDVWVSALLWGVWCMLLIGLPVVDLALMMIVIAGLIAAATSTLVSDYKSFIGFTGILIGSLVVTVILSGTTRDHVSLLLLIALFIPFMLSVHGRAHAVLVSRVEGSTRLRVSEEETAKGRDFMNALVAHAPSAIVVLDQEGRVLRANPAFERITGFTWGEVHGRGLADTLAGGGDVTSLESFLESVREGVRSVAELRLERKGGVPMWVRLSGTIAGRQAAGSAILVGEDVTEQVEAREAQEAARAQAEEVARAKSSFLASMSHEIRTPMNGILGMIELLLDTELTDEQRSSVRVVKASADGLLRILNDVLDVSKIEAGQLDLESIDFQLSQTLTEAAKVFGPQAASRGTELLMDVDKEVPPYVHGDPVRLRQIITNLLSNAVKFTEGGEIVLSLHRLDSDDSGARIRFGVRDTGIGIPKDKQQRVFGEFEQADQSTTRVHGGTGLGLTISRRLVEMMGGTLELESEEGVGSEFFFVLTMPIAEADPQEKRVQQTVSLRGCRVLIVDDNATARRISGEAVASEGATAEEATGVDEGLAMLRGALDGTPYDIVILDHLMPERDGFDFAREVSGDAELEGTRMLMLTSSAATGGKRAAREVGIGGYLAKPVARADLLRALSSLLMHHAPDGRERRLITNETLTRRGEAVRVLLAEDNAVNQQVAMALLKKRGYQVDLVDDGRKALHAVQESTYDIVLMDIQMPEMDGLEATRQIRELPGFENLPIVALTAHAFQEERDRTVAAGMNDFLAKPFKPNDLYELIERWAPEPGDAARSDDIPREEPMDETNEPAPVDIEAFRAMMREVGIEEVVDATLAVYMREGPELLGKIRSAVEARDSDATRAAAHRLKSSSGNIRAEKLSELLKNLEALGREGDTGAAAELFGEVETEFDSVMRYLEGQVS